MLYHRHGKLCACRLPWRTSQHCQRTLSVDNVGSCVMRFSVSKRTVSDRAQIQHDTRRVTDKFADSHVYWVGIRLLLTLSKEPAKVVDHKLQQRVKLLRPNVPHTVHQSQQHCPSASLTACHSTVHAALWTEKVNCLNKQCFYQNNKMFYNIDSHNMSSNVVFRCWHSPSHWTFFAAAWKLNCSSVLTTDTAPVKRLYCCVTHFHFPAAFCCGCNLEVYRL